MVLSVVFLMILATQSLSVAELNVQETAWRFQSLSHKKVLKKLLPNKRASVGSHFGFGKFENDAGDCSWDTSDASCDISFSASANIFRQSDSQYTQLIAQIAECEALSLAESCRANEKCLWDSEHLHCGFAQIDLGHEDSPCVSKAPAMVKLYIYSQVCTSLKSNDTCLANPNCAWDDADEVCDADDWVFLYGFTHGDFDKVIDYKAPLYIQQFDEAFDPAKGVAFTFGDILDWDPEPNECPESTPKAACDFADAIYQSELPTVLYCNLKYGQIFDFPLCFQDPLCDFDYSSVSCTADDKVIEEAVIDGLKILIPSIEHEADREVMQTVLDCHDAESKIDCKGSCMWFETEEGSTCGVGDEMWMRKVAGLGTDQDDPVCTFLSTLADSGCVDIMNPENCTANANCIVDIYEECVPSTGYLIADTLEKDESVQASYSELQEECTGYTTAYACKNSADPEIEIAVISVSVV